MERNSKGQFIKGTNGETYNGFGIWYDKKGYPTIWLNNKNIKLHVYVWEKENGEKPVGYQLHHKDFNKRNYNLINLQLVTQSDHFKIHAGWIKTNGEWTHKPCTKCGELYEISQYYTRKGYTPSPLCKKCHIAQCKERLNDPQIKETNKIYKAEWYKKNKLRKGGDENA